MVGWMGGWMEVCNCGVAVNGILFCPTTLAKQPTERPLLVYHFHTKQPTHRPVAVRDRVISILQRHTWSFIRKKWLKKRNGVNV